MNHAEANRIALAAGQAIVAAARPLDVVLEGVAIHVEPRVEKAHSFPTLPRGEPLPGFAEPHNNIWPAPVTLRCSWSGGSIDLLLQWGFWRASARYKGHIGVEVATQPLHRQVLWSSLSQRIMDAFADGSSTTAATIPVSLALFDREGGEAKRAYQRHQLDLARAAGLTFITPTTASLFQISRSSGVEMASEAFERIVRASLVKLPFVTRGEEGDLAGDPYVNVGLALRATSAKGVASVMEAPPEPTADLAAQDNALFDELTVSGFGAIDDFTWSNLGQINVLVGRNDTGKSTLLKLGYAVARSVQEYTLLTESARPAWRDVLSEKLMWTFQPASGNLGDLVRRGADVAAFGAVLRNETYTARIARTDGRSPVEATAGSPQPNFRALFVPPKEILTHLDAITAWKEQLKRFGFDDTYYDLAVALRGEVIRDARPESLERVLRDLRKMFSGEIVREAGKFVLDRGEQRFAMSEVAEGIKKLGLFTRLIQNGEIQRGTVLFIDEPETNLHPGAARVLVRMLYELSLSGIQIFVATHSYFILKQLEIVARKHQASIRVCGLTNRDGALTATFHDLGEGMPPNEITHEALAMADEDADLALES